MIAASGYPQEGGFNDLSSDGMIYSSDQYQPPPSDLHQSFGYNTGDNFSSLASDTRYGEYYSPPSGDKSQSVIVEGDDESMVAGGSPKDGSGHISCDPCKRSHNKCSGETPSCKQCQRRKLQCTYSPQKKRGPKSGQLKALQDEVQQLNDIIRQQKEQIDQLKSGTSVSDTGKKRKPGSLQRGGSGGALVAPDPHMSTEFTTPAFVSEYIRLFEEYIQPCCIFHDPNLQRTSLDNVKQLMSLPANTAEPRTAKLLLQMYSMLATGAQVFGNPVHANEFVNRARMAAQQVFDVSDLQTAVGFDRMAFFYVGAADFEKARTYNGLALKICENMDLPKGHEVYLSVLLGRGMLAKSLEEKFRIAQQLRESGNGHGAVLGIVVILKTKLHLFRNGEPINGPEVLPLMQEAEGHLKDRAVPEKRLAVTRAMVRGLKAGVYFAMGQTAIAEQNADAATSLAKQLGLTGQYTSFCAAAGIEWAAEVHLHLGKIDMLRDDSAILDSIAAKFPIMLDVARRYSQALETLVKSSVPTLMGPPPTLALPGVGTESLQSDLEALDQFLHADLQKAAPAVPDADPLGLSLLPPEDLTFESILNSSIAIP